MGYVFCGDALGTTSLFAEDPGAATRMIRALGETAAQCASSPPPKVMDADSPGKGSAFALNDMVIYYAPSLVQTIHFAVELAQRMFLLAEEKGGPVGIRGAIDSCSKPPLAWHRRTTPGWSSAVLPESALRVLLPEQRKISGARIILPKGLISAEQYTSWPVGVQAWITSIEGLSGELGGSTLSDHALVADCLDVLWMNSAKEAKHDALLKSLAKFQFLNSFNPAASRHAAATAAMFRIAERRRHGIVKVLRLLARPLCKDLPLPRSHDYTEWMALSPQIKRRYDAQGEEKRLRIPIEISESATSLFRRTRA